MDQDNKPTIENIYLEYLEECNGMIEEMEEYFHKNKDMVSYSKNFIDRFSSRVSGITKRVSDRALLSEIHYKFTTHEEFNTFRVNILKLANDLSSKSFQLAKGEL